MSGKIDKPSDVEFIKAIKVNIPEVDRHILARSAEAYIAAKVVKNAIKKRKH